MRHGHAVRGGIGSSLDDGGPGSAGHSIFTTSFASIYPHYVAKAEREGRTREEVAAPTPPVISRGFRE